jgi:hypothetical protein
MTHSRIASPMSTSRSRPKSQFHVGAHVVPQVAHRSW